MWDENEAHGHLMQRLKISVLALSGGDTGVHRKIIL